MIIPASILAAASEGDLQAKEVGKQLAGFAGQAFEDFALMNKLWAAFT